MLARQILPSAFIVFYLAAVLVAAIPPPAELKKVTGERESPDDRVARRVRPTLDNVQPAVEATLNLAYAAVRPVRGYLVYPLGRLGMIQRWRMFAQPPRVNTTLAVRLVSTGPEGQTAVSVICLLPVVGENAYKPFSAYGDNAIDKAVTNAIEHVSRAQRRARTDDSSHAPEASSAAFAPVTRVFGRRLAAARPPGRDVAQRVELWFGVAPMPDRGDTDHGMKPPLDSLPLGAKVGTVVKNGASSWTLRRVDTLLP